MSQYINSLEIGSFLKMRGPFGKLNYFGDGNFKILKKFKPLTYIEKGFKKIGMIAGGSGITPFFQVNFKNNFKLLQAANINRDTAEFSLIFANKTEKDILLKKEIDEFLQTQNFKFNLMYTISNTDNNEWKGGIGNITKEMILNSLPEPGEDTIILLCGSSAFCKNFLMPILLELRYNKENIFEF